ncbi:DNA cytosine methyltransferase, partial [Enterococcus hirae]
YYRTADLFSGCGGLSLGFDRAGFHSVTAVEFDDDARASHEINFSNRISDGQYRAYGDITKITPEIAVSHLGNRNIEDKVDIIIGGFPCQAFSRLGRAALWRLAGKKNAHIEDPRATMYEYLIQYVNSLKPLAFVIENVKEIGNFNNKNVAYELAAEMD